MAYFLVESAIPLDVPTSFVIFYRFRRLVEPSVSYCVNVIQWSSEGVLVHFEKVPLFSTGPLFFFFGLLVRLSYPFLLSFFLSDTSPWSVFLLVKAPFALRRASLESSNFRYLRTFL